MAKRIFGVIFLLVAGVCGFAAYTLMHDGNKNDAMGWAGGGGAAFLFALVLLFSGRKPKPLAG
jgi:hypothetical protein